MAVVIAPLTVTPAAAAERKSAAALSELPPELVGHIRPGDSFDKIRADLLRRFKNEDIDGGGVSESDYDKRQQLAAAAMRGRLIGNFLARDLNGDGKIDREELTIFHSRSARQPIRSHGVVLSPTKGQIQQTLNTLVQRDLAADTDNDGTLTFKEITAWANKHPSLQRVYQLRRPVPLTLDRNGDGVVSEAEFTLAVDQFFATYDADHDGKFSPDELETIRRTVAKRRSSDYEAQRARRKAMQIRKKAEACRFPKAPNTAKLLLLSIYGGKGLSTVGLGGDESVVGVADVWIEPGQRPLYILVSSYRATVWRFTGNIDRVIQVVANAQQADARRVPRVGVMGIPAERVHVAEANDCLQYFYKTDSAKAKQMARLIPFWTGRTLDNVFAQYAVSGVSLPSGVFERTAVYADAVKIISKPDSAALWKQMRRYYPGGLVGINAQKVVSSLPARPYSILPDRAGLAQLVDRGALRVIGTSQAITFDAHTNVKQGYKVFNMPTKFLVLKKFQYPAGLGLARFVLIPGVDRPTGSPGASRIESADR